MNKNRELENQQAQQDQAAIDEYNRQQQAYMQTVQEQALQQTQQAPAVPQQGF